MALSHSPNIVTNGLVLCLDAGNKRSYPGTGTAWKDLSDNASIGTLTNGPTFSNKNNGVIVFDGTNDYVQYQNTTTITNLSGLTNFTVEVIFQFNILPTTGFGQFFMANVNPTGSPPNLTGGFQIGYIPSPNRFSFGTYGNSGSFFVVEYNITPNTNTWYHLIGLKSTSGYYLYLNGILVATNLTNTNGGNAPTTLKIGLRERDLNFQNASEFYFNGNLATCRLYNKNLLESEVKQNYNATRKRFGL